MNAIKVPKGYKQSAIGVIPNEWEVHCIDDIFNLVNGRAFKPSDWKSTGIPIIRIQNLNDEESEPNYYQGHVEARHIVEYGDLLFAWSGTLGTSFGARIWRGPTGVLNQHIFKVIPRQGKIESTFTHIALSTAQNLIEKETHGFKASFVHIKKSDLTKILLSIPSSKFEQKAIATALSDTDALIESLKQLLTKKRQVKQGAMQELLTGQRRLPGFSGEWEHVQFGIWGQCHRGVSYNPDRDLSAFDTNHSIRLLRSNNVQDAAITLSDVQFVDKSRVKPDQTLRANDILICMANGSRNLVGKAGDFNLEDGYCYTFGAFMGAFRPNEDQANPRFVFYYFQSETFRRHVAILLAGSSINNLSPSSIESCSVFAPKDKEEQTAIADTLSAMDSEVLVLEIQLQKTRAIKQGMMQELLTGRIRLI